MFDTVEQSFERHVVVPDLHGEYELLQKTIELYFGAEDICFVFLGDLIDKRRAPKHDKGVQKTLGLVKDLGNRAIITLANHEWSMLAALYDKSSLRREAHVWGDLNFYCASSTLRSYGVNLEAEKPYEEFKNIFEGLGHSALLQSATPYFETEKFIAVHAGVERDWDWEAQKDYLEMACSDMGKGIYELQPSMWFSTELACDVRPIYSTYKIVVSGHAHYLTSSPKDYSYPIKVLEDRVVNNGKRVRLASQLNNTNQSLCVWQDWDESIIEVTRD